MAELPVEAPAAKEGRAKGYDFHMGGPRGALVLTIFTPAISVYLWLCIHRYGGGLVWPTEEVLAQIPMPTGRAAALFFGFVLFQVALDLLLPAKRVEGLTQRDGVVLTYRLNGLASFVVSVVVVGALLGTGVVPGQLVVDELGSMLIIAIVFSFAFGLFLFFYGQRSTRAEVRSGNVIYDFFMGTALNPRIGSFDLKFFFESKIGLTMWVAIVMAMAAAQWESTGAVSTPMILVGVFQLFYVADFYVFEEAMLSTWDINYENYGFMLAFGFVVWMPFNFSLQAQYLYFHDPQLSGWAVASLLLLNFAGYYIFRTANLQKHRFRTRPGSKIWGKAPTYIQTKRGPKLLTSGWWGRARHCNYLGDLMMALAWCLTAGFAHLPPYFYFLYFAPLLIDRERRDHRVCKQKYGADWDEYCRQVRYRIIPGIY